MFFVKIIMNSTKNFQNVCFFNNGMPEVLLFEICPGTWQCVKSICIHSFPGRYSPSFGLNTMIYRVNLCIQSKWGKIRTRKTQNTDTFHAVWHNSKKVNYVGKSYYKPVLGQLPPKKIALKTLKLTLTLTQTLTLAGGQFSSGAILRIPYKP